MQVCSTNLSIHDRIREESEIVSKSRDNFIKVLAHIKTEQRKQKEKTPLNCYVVHFGKVKKFLQHLPCTSEVQRIQVLFKIRGHYSAADIEISKRFKKIVLLDSVLNSYYKQLEPILFECGFKVILEANTGLHKPQSDEVSCALFAFDFLCQTSKIPQLYDQFLAKSTPKQGSKKVRYILWKEFPPGFLKNFQSLSFFDSFPELKELPYKKTRLGSYLQENTVENNGRNRFENHAILHKLERYKQVVENFIKDKEAKTLQDIISQNA